MARASAKVELLRNVPLFSGLSAKELMSLSRLMDEIDLKPGTVIIREGNTGGEFFIVVEGTIEVKRKRPRGWRGSGPGDYLGRDRADRSRAAHGDGDRGGTEARLLVLASREFHSMLASDPRIENKILRTLAARVRDMSPTHPGSLSRDAATCSRVQRHGGRSVGAAGGGRRVPRGGRAARSVARQMRTRAPGSAPGGR